VSNSWARDRILLVRCIHGVGPHYAGPHYGEPRYGEPVPLIEKSNGKIARQFATGGVLAAEDLAVLCSRQRVVRAARVVGLAGVAGAGMRPERRSQPRS
jgi:hypothetical protein